MFSLSSQNIVNVISWFFRFHLLHEMNVYKKTFSTFHVVFFAGEKMQEEKEEE